jgi:hypothetical protein
MRVIGPDGVSLFTTATIVKSSGDQTYTFVV